jgi:D-glycero-alpha-D-manno-heptose-7-phosphate kinase
MEHVREVDDIQHVSVRETLKFMKIKEGMEIHHDGDLPARTGLGSSSSFTVGLLHALYALKGIMPSKMQLAQEAIYIEQELNKENVGCQDQILASLGGFNRIDFSGDHYFSPTRITLAAEKVRMLEKHLMLFFTGFSRNASEIAEEQIKNTPHKGKELTTMYEMVEEATKLLNKSDFIAFGKLLHESWLLKRSLSHKISNHHIDEIYNTAIKAGALGGKLLGAGGGGFVLLLVEPEKQAKLREGLQHLLYVPFEFDELGSQIIFYQP